MPRMTEDDVSRIVRDTICYLMFTGSLGGGTLTVQRLVVGGDQDNDADWVPLADSLASAVYTISPGGDRYEVPKGTLLRAKLTGSTAPNLEYSFNS